MLSTLIEYNLMFEIKCRIIVKQRKSNIEQLLSSKNRISNNLSNDNKIKREKRDK